MACTNRQFHVEQSGTSDDLNGEITMTNTARCENPTSIDTRLGHEVIRSPNRSI